MNRTEIKNWQRRAGFTLIELMIVVAVVAILAAVALPAYNAHILKSHRTDAKTALFTVASQEQQYYSANNSYTAQLTKLGYSADSAVPVSSGSTTTYTLTVTSPGGAASANAASFSVTATAVNTQANDSSCGNFTLDSTGAQSNSGSASNCW